MKRSESLPFLKNLQTKNESHLQYNYNIEFLYRYDSRPPREIMTVGFHGTVSHDNAFATFGGNTVFSTRTIEGADKFCRICESAKLFRKNTELERDRYKAPTLYLYRIYAKGLRTLSFVKNYNLNANAFIEQAANIRVERYKKEFSQALLSGKGIGQFMHYTSYGPRQYKKYIAEDTHSRLDAFLLVDEFHIEGPIPPSRIQWMSSDNLKALNLE